MSVVETEAEVRTLHVNKEIQIAAPIDVVFETLLSPTGIQVDLNLKLEAWPGGRWFRDLGNNTGHLWGHVQVIKPPKLLEITGPMMMSYPVSSHVQYRLAENAGGTLLSVLHRAMGLLDKEHMEGVHKGWLNILESVRDASQKKASR